MSRQDRRLSERVESTEERLARASEDADDELRTGAELSDDDREDLLRLTFMQDRLPNIPPIAGFHVIWLTTSNTGDTPISRQRLGYVPVRMEDVPTDLHGLFTQQVGSGDGAGGLLTVNEMIAYKLPERLYRRYMKIIHHDMPREEELGIASRTDQVKEQIVDREGRFFEGKGMERLRKQPPAPRPETWGTGADPDVTRAVLLGQRAT